MAYLKLVRFPLFLTAAADSITGYLLVNISILPFEIIIYGLISSLIFIFAVVLNDLIDIEKDKRIYPSRPLASGQITKRSAIILCSITAFTLLLLSFIYLNKYQLVKLTTIIFLILSYNILLKETFLAGSLCMATIRVINLSISSDLLDKELELALISHFCYILMCCNISLIEKRPSKITVIINFIFSVFLYWVLAFYFNQHATIAVVPIIIFMAALLISLRDIKKYGEILSVPKQISFVIILDACYLLINTA